MGNFVVGVDGTSLLGRGDLPDRRVAPADVSGVVLAPFDPLVSPLRVTANHVSVTGITVVNGASDRETVVRRSHTATDALQQPDDVTFDRVAVLAGESGGIRGFSLHTRRVTLTRSYVAGFSLPRAGCAGCVRAERAGGPYILRDNYLEGSGRKRAVRGSHDSHHGLRAGDVQMVGNTLAKPDAWRAKTGAVKKASNSRRCGGR